MKILTILVTRSIIIGKARQMFVKEKMKAEKSRFAVHRYANGVNFIV